MVVYDDYEYDKFHAVAGILQTGFGLSFTHKLDGLETCYWDFQFNSCELTLHYHVMTWISIFPEACKEASEADNRAVIELGELLSRYFIEHNIK